MGILSDVNPWFAFPVLVCVGKDVLSLPINGFRQSFLEIQALSAYQSSPENFSKPRDEACQDQQTYGYSFETIYLAPLKLLYVVVMYLQKKTIYTHSTS